MQLNERSRDFVERMGLTVDRLGLTRTAGRMLGILLLSERPMSLDELAQVLNVSKASISTNARLCDQIGVVRRVGKGDRRDYYEIAPTSFERAVAWRIATIHELIALADVGLAAVGRSNAVAKRRLEFMRAFYQFFNNELEQMLERWRDRKGRRHRRSRKRD